MWVSETGLDIQKCYMILHRVTQANQNIKKLQQWLIMQNMHFLFLVLFQAIYICLTIARPIAISQKLFFILQSAPALNKCNGQGL